MNIQRMSIPLFFLFSAFACSPSSESSRIDRSEIPSSYKIVIGEGGGFAGLWTGYSILPGDTLLEWHGRTPEENAVFAGTLPTDTVAVLWHEIRSQQLLDHAPTAVQANFVQILSITLDGKDHDFGWLVSTDRDTTASQAREFRARCLKAIHESLGH